MVRRWLTVAFLLSGASLTILQTVMVRELLVSFAGNELSIGLVLGSWLFLQAWGSALAGRVLASLPQPAGYAVVQLFLALMPFPALLLAAHIRAVLGAVPGEILSPAAAFLGALMALALLALPGGAAFAVGCRAMECTGEVGTLHSSRVYVLEAVGALAGGVVLTYLFFPLLTPLQIALLLSLLNLASAAALFLLSSPRRTIAGIAASLLGLVALVLLLSPAGLSLEEALVAGRWAPYPVAFVGNSPYGNVAVIRMQEQVTVLASGSAVLTAPAPDIATVEEVVHLPALFLRQPPRRALVIGGGVGGVLAELQRYPLERLDYAELDPLLIRAVQSVSTTLTAAELRDERLRIALEDGRRFVRRCADAPGYELVLLNLPPPSTLELNRLYTREFLEQVQGCLLPGGVLAVPAPPARTAMSPAARDLLAGYSRTLEAVFPYVRAIPADGQTLWVASREPLNLGVDELAGRLRSNGLELRMLRPEYLRYLLDEQVEAAFSAGLARGPAVEVNRDGYPAALRYTLAYESARLAPALTPFFRGLGQVRWWHLALGIVGLTLAGLLLLRRPAGVLSTAVASTGLVGMTADLLVILAFQMLLGYLYQQVGLLVAAFMAGLSLGALAMTAAVGRLRCPWRALAFLEAAVALSMAGLGGVLGLLLLRPTAGLGEHLVLLLLNLVAGMLVGLEFPLITHILAGATTGQARTAGIAAALYAWDLVGATLGAVAVATVLLPALGLVETALLMALVKVGSLLLVGKFLLRPAAGG